MPPRPSIDPTGHYHVGSRGCYGRPLFETVGQHEVFLRMYARAAAKYRWETLAWALMFNHHHFVVRLLQGGLSEGMRELHGGYSRWIHTMQGQTGQGHLVRHAFFARLLESEDDVLATCCYVDLNPVVANLVTAPEQAQWCGYRATVGLEQPRRFHTPIALLDLIDAKPGAARAAYRQLVRERLAESRELAA